jgi:hypothetical protein
MDSAAMDSAAPLTAASLIAAKEAFRIETIANVRAKLAPMFEKQIRENASTIKKQFRDAVVVGNNAHIALQLVNYDHRTVKFAALLNTLGVTSCHVWYWKDVENVMRDVMKPLIKQYVFDGDFSVVFCFDEDCVAHISAAV